MSLKWPPRQSQCKTCIFRPESIQMLRPGRLGEIQSYLIQGTTHLCHTPHRGKADKLACRGGRDFQLEVWHRLGHIEEPTDEALAKKMEAMGL